MDIEKLEEIVKIQSQLIDILSSKYLSDIRGGSQRDELSKLRLELRGLQE